MNQLHALVSTIVASAIECAGRGGGDADIILGLVAGLRRLRAVVAAQAGYGAACSIEDSIHALMLDRARQAGNWAPVPLPSVSVRTPRAVQILEDAAMSCLALNSYFQGNTAIGTAVQVFAGALVHRLGGIPDWKEFQPLLRGDDAVQEEDEEEANVPWVVPAVH